MQMLWMRLSHFLAPTPRTRLDTFGLRGFCETCSKKMLQTEDARVRLVSHVALDSPLAVFDVAMVPRIRKGAGISITSHYGVTIVYSYQIRKRLVTGQPLAYEFGRQLQPGAVSTPAAVLAAAAAAAAAAVAAPSAPGPAAPRRPCRVRAPVAVAVAPPNPAHVTATVGDTVPAAELVPDRAVARKRTPATEAATR